MINSGSGSCSEFSEFRIHADPDPCRSRSDPCYLSIFGNCKQTTLNSIIKKNLSTICHFLCHFLFHTSVLQYTKPRIRREIRILITGICSFMFCWIQIRNNNSGSGSRQKFRIHADPDPQHCF